jgi:hypothetical protein
VEDMTIEELSVSSQREFEIIRNEMATREELNVMEGNILRAIERMDDRLSVYASRWNGEFERLTDNVRGLESRLRPRDAPE